MSMFNIHESPSCANCRFATKYIPAWGYPFADPFCAKGMGKCEVDKLCGSWELIGRLSR